MDAQTIVSILAALVAGGVGKWVLDAVNQHRQGFISVKKSETENQIAQNEQAVKIYNSVIEQIRKDVESLEKKCEELEKQYYSNNKTNDIGLGLVLNGGSIMQAMNYNEKNAGDVTANNKGN